MKDTDPRKKELERKIKVTEDLLKDYSNKASDEIDPKQRENWIRGIERCRRDIKKFEEELKDP